MNAENSFFTQNRSIKKKIMIIIPHEDDEINVAGGILANYAQGTAEVKVVFTTNGDCFEAAYVRQKEAYESLKLFGVQKNHIVFLGYPDQLNMEQVQWSNKKGQRETQGTKYFPDYRYARDGYHSELSHDNLVKDIRDAILDFLPDEIYCVDFDSHSDHRAASLAFEVAMGEILKTRADYTPMVYKGFAYPTAFKGVFDFGAKNNSTKFQKEEFNQYAFQNPYYRWEERVRFPVVYKARSRILSRNIIYKALAKHKSQLIICQAYGIINDDQIFWQRRTDNLLRLSDICVSSGVGEYLNDFILFDSSNIMQGNCQFPQFDKRVWIPDAADCKKSITVEFKRDVTIKSIVFYLGCNTDVQITKVKITMDNGFERLADLNANKVQKLEFTLQKNIKRMEIQVLEATGEDAGFSEIEVFDEEKPEVKFIKLMEDGEFCYKTDSLEGKSIYMYDGYASIQLPIDKAADVKKTAVGKKEYYTVEWTENSQIFDFVEYKKQDMEWFGKVIKAYNKVIIRMTYCLYRVLRKLRNVAKSAIPKKQV